MGELDIFQKIDKYRHGILSVSLTSGIGVFGVSWTILEASGISGSDNVVWRLLLASFVVCVFTYIFLLHRKLFNLSAEKSGRLMPETRASVEKAISSLEPDMASTVRTSLDHYEETIRDLQDQLRPLAYPMHPILVEGGTYEISNGISIVLDSFLMDAYPVTNQEYADFISHALGKQWTQDAVYKEYGIPYYLCEFKDEKPPEDKWDHPVVWINWYAAVAFCNWRSVRDGKEPVYKISSPIKISTNFENSGWRLPTEAEWERVTIENHKAFQKGVINPSVANYENHYRGTTSVGRFKPNALGIWDLLGNVKEWCQDWHDPEFYENLKKHNTNPRGLKDGKFKSYRGASWMDGVDKLRVTQRGRIPPQNTNPDFGFRCVRRI